MPVRKGNELVFLPPFGYAYRLNVGLAEYAAARHENDADVDFRARRRQGYERKGGSGEPIGMELGLISTACSRAHEMQRERTAKGALTEICPGAPREESDGAVGRAL